MPRPPPRTRPATPLTAPSTTVRSKSAVAWKPARPVHEGGDGAVVVPALGHDVGLDRLDAVLEVDGGGEHDAAHGGDDGDDRQRDLGAGGDVDVGLVAPQPRLEPAAEAR